MTSSNRRACVGKTAMPQHHCASWSKDMQKSRMNNSRVIISATIVGYSFHRHDWLLHAQGESTWHTVISMLVFVNFRLVTIKTFRMKPYAQSHFRSNVVN